MPTITTSEVADAISYAMQHCDDDKEETTVRWIAEIMADEIYGQASPDNIAKRQRWLDRAVPSTRGRELVR